MALRNRELHARDDDDDESYGYINILCHIFNFARNNQQQLVTFIVKKH